MIRSNRNRTLLGTLFFLFTSIMTALAQAGSVDPGFNAVPTISLATDTSIGYFVQPDGKVLVYSGPAMMVNGAASPGIFRLNADGTTDTSFSYCNCADIGVGSVMLTPNGKYILAGTTSPNHAKMIRLNSDGSLDNSFSVFFQSSGSPGVTGASYTLEAVQPDGKVIATLLHWGNIMGTWTSYSMTRFNVDGTVDGSFTGPPLDGGHLVSTSAFIDLLPDGRFYFGVSSGNHLGRQIKISLRNANGTPDPSFTEFTRSIGGGSFISLSDMAIDAAGNLLAAGVFWPSQLGGPYNKNIFRFLPTGTSDPAFNPPLSASGGSIHVLPDGKILHSTQLSHTVADKILRLNSDGSVDNTYVQDPAITSLRSWQADGMNRPIVFAVTADGPRLVRLLENGAIDPGYNPHFAALSSTRLSIAQPDGKVIVAGEFTGMNGVARNGFARLNSDGSLDTSFVTGLGFGNGAPVEFLLQPDGKIVAVGAFQTYNGVTAQGIVRLNPDGSRDDTFSANVNSIEAVALQSDGKILIGGSFQAVNGTPRTRLARLTSTGELDAGFDVAMTTTSSFLFVRDILIQGDGKIVIGGEFSTVNGTARNNLARLNSNGALDTTFDAPTSGRVEMMRRQTDGKFVINDDNAQRLIRRHSDGSVDTSFISSIPQDADDSNGNIFSFLIQPDGTILLAGSFAKYNNVARNNFARLRPNGTLDTSFVLDANATVGSVEPYSTGKVIISGIFNNVGNVPRAGIARLNIAPLVRTTPFDFDGDRRADFSVYRPSTNVWYEAFSSDGTVAQEVFGIAGDILAPADYDGDGKTDESMFRPSAGQWWYKSSIDGNHILNFFGQPGDIPRPSDFDGDGKADFVFFRPSTNVWYRFGTTTGQLPNKVFGAAGDMPLVGDFDGDGKGDLAVFRPSTGDWWYAASSANEAFRQAHWGQNGDLPVPADYDGDGRTDFAIYRPSDGGWYIYNSGNGSVTTTAFGTSTDRPAPADYDGDGRADLAVFRPSTGIWYLLFTTSGFAGYQFGISTDVVIPGSLNP